MQGARNVLPDALGELRCLPLAERDIALAGSRARYLPALLLAAAMALVALDLVPVAIAFFGLSVVLLVSNVLTLRQAYDAIDWPILILLGALIPVSEAVRTTGGTELLAGWLAATAGALPPLGLGRQADHLPRRQHQRLRLADQAPCWRGATGSASRAPTCTT